MKKIISLVLVVSLLLTMTFTSTFTANAEEKVVKTTQIDLTQDTANLFATTGNTTSTTAAVEDGKLKVNISAYERGLTSQSYGTQTWFPTYLLAVGGAPLKLLSLDKAIVEVKYKVVAANANADWGAQIGIGNFNGGKGSNIYVRTSKKHTTADVGKEFTLTSVFNVDSMYAAKIAFAGGGTIEISSVVVRELPAQYIKDYAVVKYVDGTNESTEFSKLNAAPKASTDGRHLDGWYAGSDFSGEPVTTVTGDTTLYGKFTYTTTKIDLTQDTANLFATTGSTTSTTAAVEDGKLKVHLSAYERALTSQSYGTQTWFPTYLIAVGGAMHKLTKGNKAIVEVKYKVVEANANADWGAQIGIGNFNGGKGSNIYVRTSKKHTTADVGKEFTLTSVFTVDGYYSAKIAFAGGGDIEISSVVVHELPAEYIDEYAAVKYVDGTSEVTEFTKKNAAPKTPANDGRHFEGWYASSDFSGEPVTTVTGDTTLYGKFTYTTTNIDLTQDVSQLFATTGSTSSTTATVEDGKLKVHLSAYERSLTSQTYGTQTWFPTYLIAVDGAMHKLTKGNKAIVEVKYKVVEANANADWGAQIGIGNFNGGSGSNIYVRNYKKHLASDAGKEFTIASVFTVDGYYSAKIAFAGGGEIEISSIVVHELPAQYINEYAAVKYVEADDETTEFAPINSAPRSAKMDNFASWNTGEDFRGTTVTTITEDTTLYAKPIINKNEINLTQAVSDLFATTGNTTSTTAAVEDGKLKVHLSAYERGFAETSYGTQTWFPTYLLAVDGSALKLPKGDKAIVEVKYKVVEANANADWGAQIGIGNFNGGKGSNIYVRNYKKHFVADKGKDFTLTSVFTVDNYYATKIAFAGGGDIEISSVVVYSLDSQYIDDYAAVQCVNGNNSDTEFLKNGSTLTAELDDTIGHNFGGWYSGEDKVTTVMGDVTAEAKWFDKMDVNMDASIDICDLVITSLGDQADGLNRDVNRDNAVSDDDLLAIRMKLLRIAYVTVNGAEISDYRLETRADASFMTTNATALFADYVEEALGVNLSDNAAAANSIVVGIANKEGSETTALGNLTGVKGDVYGLDDYKIFIHENNLYIEGGSDYATAFAINTFKDFIAEYNIFPAGYELYGKYNGEKNLLDGYSYVWGDEFNGETLDTGKWYLSTGEKPGPYYAKDNSYFASSRLDGTYGGPWSDPDGNPSMQEGTVTLLDEEGNNYYLQDGLLIMNTKKTDAGYTATQINAKQSFKYGIMTARVKIATKNGACSTLWSRTVDDNGASVNEMDFIENFGSDQIVPNLHTWVNYTDHTNHKANNDIDMYEPVLPGEGESLSDAFHEIALYWDEEKIVFYFDGRAYLEQDIASDAEKWEAFHKSTYMIMGVSAPSGYYSTASGGQNPGDYMGSLINSFSENYAIDYVRVFQK